MKEGKKKIVLVISDDTLMGILDLSIRKEYNVEVLTFGDFFKAREFLTDHQDVECIIADEGGARNFAFKVSKLAREFEGTIPVIAIVDPKSKGKGGTIARDGGYYFSSIPKPNVIDVLRNVLHQFIHKRTHNPEFIHIKVDLILKMNNVACDCYVKTSTNRHIRILSRGDFFGQDDYDKYQGRGISELYVRFDEVEMFLERLSDDFKAWFELSHSVSPASLTEIRKFSEIFKEESDLVVIDELVDALRKTEDNSLAYAAAMNVCKRTLKIIKKVVSRFGANPDVQQVTRATVAVSLAVIKKAPGINKLFEKASEDESNYITNHSLLLLNVCCNLATLLGWNSNLTFYKLALSSLLHDITIEESSLATYRTMADVMNDASKYSEGQIRNFLNHPEDASKLVRDFRMIPADVDLIILEHHERPDGSGFPAKKSFTSISPLACVMIVAHDLVSYILDKEEAQNNQTWNIVSFLNRYRLLYQDGVFNEVFGAMWKAVMHSKVA